MSEQKQKQETPPGFDDLGGGQGFLKAGFQGFEKAGKTVTATYLGIATMRLMKSDKPVCMFDTEGGSAYIAKLVEALTGKKLLGKRSRAFSDLMQVARGCVSSGLPLLLVDSVTHIWRELQAAYLAEVNEARAMKGMKPRTKLEFQDWGPLKEKWAEWTDFYLNAPLHIIICGRAGDVYEFEQNEETGKKELIKTGTKMKTEKEFGFEPSLLVEMQREQVIGDTRKIMRRATVIGDRYNAMDGAQCYFESLPSNDKAKLEKELKAVADFFAPHLSNLCPGTHATIDMDVKTTLGVDDTGDAEWQRERREREILCEEIKGQILKLYPGRSDADQQGKGALLERIFGTLSWTKVESTQSKVLREGLEKIKAEIAEKSAAPQEAAPESGEKKAKKGAK